MTQIGFGYRVGNIDWKNASICVEGDDKDDDDDDDDDNDDDDDDDGNSCKIYLHTVNRIKQPVVYVSSYR